MGSISLSTQICILAQSCDVIPEVFAGELFHVKGSCHWTASSFKLKWPEWTHNMRLVVAHWWDNRSRNMQYHIWRSAADMGRWFWLVLQKPSILFSFLWNCVNTWILFLYIVYNLTITTITCMLGIAIWQTFHCLKICKFGVHIFTSCNGSLWNRLYICTKFDLSRAVSLIFWLERKKVPMRDIGIKVFSHSCYTTQLKK